MMMKADVLSGFETIKVCTAYNYNGHEIKHLPYTLDSEHLTPVYTEMPGWKEDLTRLENAENLPNALNNYIAFLEKELDTPITLVSVGPDRKQTIHRTR
jgi:adenylosuccinate synthase